MTEEQITFKQISEEELEDFIKDLHHSFLTAIHALNANPKYLPSAETIRKSFYDPNTESYRVYIGDKKVAGVMIKINSETQINLLDHFFVDADFHCKGYGYSIWKKIEEKYPDTKIWETFTPYFEKRNLNFYLNKCQFKIVEYYNKFHKDPHGYQQDDDDEFFRFEKVM